MYLSTRNGIPWGDPEFTSFMKTNCTHNAITTVGMCYDLFSGKINETAAAPTPPKQEESDGRVHNNWFMMVSIGFFVFGLIAMLSARKDPDGAKQRAARETRGENDSTSGPPQQSRGSTATRSNTNSQARESTRTTATPGSNLQRDPNRFMATEILHQLGSETSPYRAPPPSYYMRTRDELHREEEYGWGNELNSGGQWEMDDLSPAPEYGRH